MVEAQRWPHKNVTCREEYRLVRNRYRSAIDEAKTEYYSGKVQECAGPDSRNDPHAIGSDTILWSWSADCIPQTPITIGSSDRENTKPNSLLPIESWHKSFTREFRIEITWSWLNEKRQTDDIYSWRHNGRCGDFIYECRYESVMASSVHAHSVCSQYNTVWTCHIWQVCVCDYRDWKYTNCWHMTDHVPVHVSQ